MFSNATEFTEPMTEDTERNAIGTDDILADEEARAERSRQYRRLYKQRKKDKDKELQQRVEETELEVERLRLEQAALISQSHALSSLCSYSNSMIDALTAAASASAAKARSLGGRALEGVSTFRGWAKHQWIMLPTATELMTGSVWTPSDDHMRFVMKISKPEDFVSGHARFLERLAQLLEEGKKYPEAQNHAELKINYLLSIWVRFTILCATERRETMEEIVCTYQLKSLREQAAAGEYTRPHMLQYSPSELAGFVDLSPEQRAKLEEHWQQFNCDIRMARAALGKSTAKVVNGIEATMETGQYKPASSVDAAECFLLATDAADASDEFLAQEGRAFIKLWIGAIQVLTPMQTAVVLTSCQPLVPHLPDVCNMLLHTDNNDNNNSAIEGQGFSITDVDDGQ